MPVTFKLRIDISPNVFVWLTTVDHIDSSELTGS